MDIIRLLSEIQRQSQSEIDNSTYSSIPAEVVCGLQSILSNFSSPQYNVIRQLLSLIFQFRYASTINIVFNNTKYDLAYCSGKSLGIQISHSYLSWIVKRLQMKSQQNTRHTRENKGDQVRGLESLKVRAESIGVKYSSISVSPAGEGYCIINLKDSGNNSVSTPEAGYTQSDVDSSSKLNDRVNCNDEVKGNSIASSDEKTDSYELKHSVFDSVIAEIFNFIKSSLSIRSVNLSYSNLVSSRVSLASFQSDISSLLTSITLFFNSNNHREEEARADRYSSSEVVKLDCSNNHHIDDSATHIDDYKALPSIASVALAESFFFNFISDARKIQLMFIMSKFMQLVSRELSYFHKILNYLLKLKSLKYFSVIVSRAMNVSADTYNNSFFNPDINPVDDEREDAATINKIIVKLVKMSQQLTNTMFLDSFMCDQSHFNAVLFSVQAWIEWYYDQLLHLDPTSHHQKPVKRKLSQYEEFMDDLGIDENDRYNRSSCDQMNVNTLKSNPVLVKNCQQLSVKINEVSDRILTVFGNNYLEVFLKIYGKYIKGSNSYVSEPSQYSISTASCKISLQESAIDTSSLSEPSSSVISNPLHPNEIRSPEGADASNSINESLLQVLVIRIVSILKKGHNCEAELRRRQTEVSKHESNIDNDDKVLDEGENDNDVDDNEVNQDDFDNTVGQSPIKRLNSS